MRSSTYVFIVGVVALLGLIVFRFTAPYDPNSIPMAVLSCLCGIFLVSTLILIDREERAIVKTKTESEMKDFYASFS